MNLDLDRVRLAIIGLGYVGLPLAVEFGKKLNTIGFDINHNRVSELKANIDSTLECTSKEIKNSSMLSFVSKLEDIKECNCYIVTVPTPIDEHKQPDLTPLIKTSEMLGEIIKKGDVVIYESTVYPGATEEVCIPVIESVSGFKFNDDFFAGYSPERINPGDKVHRVVNIKKVTSGSNEEVSDFVDSLYQTIIHAGTHKASSIKVAEASKIIENVQRDLNIALINEISIIMNKLNIDTLEVLEAAGTKWNFLPFRPGLVGGHCIGVDPYYLTHKAQSTGYMPDVILSGRRINDGMGVHIVSQLIKSMIKNRIQVDEAKVLILGFSFKENCPDFRNTKVIDIIKELHTYNVKVDVSDPFCNKDDVKKEFGIELVEPKINDYDAIIIAVGHEQYKIIGSDGIRKFGNKQHILYDLKYVLSKDEVDMRL